MTVTNALQTKELLDLGLPIEKFDMVRLSHLIKFDGNNFIPKTFADALRFNYTDEDICCSFEALFDMMPKRIETDEDWYILRLEPDHEYWACAYIALNKGEALFVGYEDDRITACFEVAKWLLQRGLIEKED